MRCGWIFLGVAAATMAVAADSGSREPFRRPLSAADSPGWTQVQLDAEAQVHADTLWIGDAGGRPVPFLREAEVRTSAVTLSVRDLVSGRDDAGRPLAEFTLELPDGGSVILRDPSARFAPGVSGGVGDARREMTVVLEIDADAPWAADVEVARDAFGQGWSNEPARRQIYDFGVGERRLEFTVTGFAAKWRVRLQGLRGDIRGVRAVTVRVAGLPGPRDVPRVPLAVAPDGGQWSLRLPGGPRRVLAVHLRLRGPLAPVRAELARRAGDPHAGEDQATPLGAAQVWEMPGLNSRAGEVRLRRPEMVDRFELKLPRGVEVVSAEAETAGESLWFVAQPGVSYYLHLAGRKESAPGDLGALPAALGGASLGFVSIGRPEADPFGKPIRDDLSVVLRRWLPWGVALAVAALGILGWRMARPRRDGDAT